MAAVARLQRRNDPEGDCATHRLGFQAGLRLGREFKRHSHELRLITRRKVAPLITSRLDEVTPLIADRLAR